MASPRRPRLTPRGRRLLALAALAGCSAPPAPPAPVPPAPPAASAAEAASAPRDEAPSPPPEPPPPPPPRVGGARLGLLPVPGFRDAVVAAPVGAEGKQPVLVATHGNYDKPEWQCEVWGQIVGQAGFVLCPRGTPRGDSPGRDDTRYEYPSNQALEREIDAGLEALARAFPEHADVEAATLAGFSLGAIMGVAIAARRPARFPRLILIEGGDRWSLLDARKFHAEGGKRVLFACSQGGCEASARAGASLLRRAGVEVREVKGKNEGHTYVGDVMKRYAEALPWLVEGDARWRLPR